MNNSWSLSHKTISISPSGEKRAAKKAEDEDEDNNTSSKEKGLKRIKKKAS